jgi:Secretion system C-terminal sorting domain
LIEEMKKYLLFAVGLSLCSFLGRAQTATFGLTSDPSDTVNVTIASTASVYSDVINLTGSGISFKWRVIATDFPSDWLTATAFSLCDNNVCRSNSGDALWNSSMGSGTSYTTTYPSNTAHRDTGSYDILMDLTSASAGSHYVTISMQDEGSGYSKNLTYVINKFPASVATVGNNDNNVQLYPNPARDEVNLVFDAISDIKTISIYNIIGRVVNVYKVNGTSANLSIENIPSGIYFVRLMNSRGEAVVTRKFTKQ